MGSSSLKMIITVLILARVDCLLEAPQSVRDLMQRIFTDSSHANITITFVKSKYAKVDFSPQRFLIRGSTISDSIACFGKALTKFGFVLGPYDLGLIEFPAIQQSGTIHCKPRYHIRSHSYLLHLAFDDLRIYDGDYWVSPDLSVWQDRGLIHSGSDINWARVQFDLARRVMARMLSLDMSPILPAFSGYVPVSIDSSFDVDIVRLEPWGSISCSQSCNRWLLPTDKLYAGIMARYLHYQALHFQYEATYYHVDVPSSLPSRLNMESELSKISNSLYRSLPTDSVWVVIRDDVHEEITFNTILNQRAKSEVLFLGISVINVE